MSVTFEQLNRHAARLNASGPFTALGVTLRYLDFSIAELSLPQVQPAHRSFDDRVSNATAVAMLETALEATGPLVDPLHQSVLLQLSVQLLRPATAGRLTVKAKVERAFEGVVLASAELFDGGLDPCASARASLRVLNNVWEEKAPDEYRAPSPAQLLRPVPSAPRRPKPMPAPPSPTPAQSDDQLMVDHEVLEMAISTAEGPGTPQVDPLSVKVRFDTSPEVLALALSSPQSLSSAFGARLPSRWEDLPVMIELALEPLKENPSLKSHWTSFIVVDGEVVGFAGYKGPPAQGTLEIACLVEPMRSGRGIATEAARQLLAHAFEQPNVTRVRALTPPEPGPATRVLEKLGFRRVGEVELTDDGPAWGWEKLRPAEAASLSPFGDE